MFMVKTYFNGGSISSNTAVTLLSASMVTVAGLSLPVKSPFQPENFHPSAGSASKVNTCPFLYDGPAGVLTTLPLSGGSLFIDKVQYSDFFLPPKQPAVETSRTKSKINKSSFLVDTVSSSSSLFSSFAGLSSV